MEIVRRDFPYELGKVIGSRPQGLNHDAPLFLSDVNWIVDLDRNPPPNAGL
ncbi:MAG: hypothetical protein ACREUF_06915 [Solimonas sp.]